MKTILLVALVTIASFSAGSASADQQGAVFGGDTYVAGQNTTIASSVERDAFGAGSNVVLSAPVAQDAHLAGFDVQSNSDVGGNLYAFGFSVSVGGSVRGDLTAFGNTVSVHPSQPVGGNLRVAGANVMLDSQANGSALITAETATINAPIKGDLSFFGRSLTFGPNATVDGQVLIHAPAAITVPASVAPAGRVIFTQLASPEYPSQAGQTAEMVAKGFLLTLWATTLWWVLLILVGIAFVTLASGLVGKLETLSLARPVRRFGLGLLALACTIGLVPAVALTVVGLLLVPFVLIGVAIACSLAYIAGAYLIALAVARRIAPITTVGRRILVLALALVVGGLVGSIPFLGWLIGIGIATYGFGVIAALIMTRWSSDDRTLLQSAPPVSPAGGTPQPV
ncbi:MAG: hypothetical protein ACTHNL_01835 [Devosia sp.]